MEKKPTPINEGLVRGNIKPVPTQNGIQKGVTKVPSTTSSRPPPPAPKK